MTVSFGRAGLRVGILLTALLAMAGALLPAPASAGAAAPSGGIPGNAECDDAEGPGSYEVEAYYSPEEVDAAVEHLAHTGQGVTTDVIGESNRGRPIHAVRVGDGDRVAFLQAGIHANELTGTRALIEVLKKVSNNSQRAREIREELTIVGIPMLNPDGAVHYQRYNDRTWEEVVEDFPQLADASGPAFNYRLPGGGFWFGARVPGFDINRDFNPDFDYVPQPEHFPGSGGVRGWYINPESQASRDLYASLEEEFGLVDVFVDLHNQGQCLDYTDEEEDETRYTPLSVSAQFLRDPEAHGAGTTYPNFDYDASRRANVAAYEGVSRGGSPFSGVTRYPQNLDLAGSAISSYQLRGSAVVLMEAGRMRHVNPQRRVGMVSKVHELAMFGLIDSLVDGTFEDIDPQRYEQIPIRN